MRAVLVAVVLSGCAGWKTIPCTQFPDLDAGAKGGWSKARCEERSEGWLLPEVSWRLRGVPPAKLCPEGFPKVGNRAPKGRCALDTFEHWFAAPCPTTLEVGWQCFVCTGSEAVTGVFKGGPFDGDVDHMTVTFSSAAVLAVSMGCTDARLLYDTERDLTPRIDWNALTP